MNQEKFGKLIKEIRQKNNLTQKEFADKYGVSYQAVSKWENGKNLPDVYLIKTISKDFNINIEDMLEGEIKNTKKTKNKIIPIITITLAIIIAIIFLIIYLSDKDFHFKTLSASCDDFKISGSIAYNKNKSSIYISDIDYCGEEDTTKYQSIDCTLYESSHEVETRISTHNYNKDETITLEQFLQDISFKVDDYKRVCKDYHEHGLYLLINATDTNNKTTSYRIPLKLSETCDL